MTEITTFLDFAGRRADGHLVKSVVPQLDGSKEAGSNCAPSCEAGRVRVDVATGAAPGAPWPPTGATIRAASGDHVGGLTPTQTAAVSFNHYRIDSDIRIVVMAVLDSMLRQRFGATVLVSYRPIAAAGHSGCPGFVGNHSIRILGIRGAGASTEYLVACPLYDGRRKGIPEGPQWIKASVIRAAAGALILDHGLSLTELRGPGKAYVSFNTVPYTPPKPQPAGVRLRFGATKAAKPRRVRVLFDRSLLRESPRKRGNNVARVVPVGFRFDVYQRVKTADGIWLGNKAGTRWLFKPGTKFVRYL